MQVRRATAEDIELLVDSRVALFRELHRSPDAGELDAFRAACRSALHRYLLDGSALAWVATVDGALSGALVLFVFPRLPSPGFLGATEGYVLNVYVAPTRRRQGVATRLMQSAVDESRRRGLSRLRLHATPDGRPLYEQFGFRLRNDEMELAFPPS